jgi:hypothetical protein
MRAKHSIFRGAAILLLFLSLASASIQLTNPEQKMSMKAQSEFESLV